MNEELVRQLKEECFKLYPNGCPVQPRGSAKTYIYLSHFLRWSAYQLYCQVYQCCNSKITLESAHKDIDEYVVALMPV